MKAHVFPLVFVFATTLSANAWSMCAAALSNGGKKVVLVDVSPTTIAIAEGLKAKGDTVYLAKTGRYPGIVDPASRLFRFWEVIDVDWEQRIAEIAPDYIVTGFDSGVEMADSLRTRFTPRFSNLPELSSARRDKGVAYDVLGRQGVAVPQGGRVTDVGAAVQLAIELFATAPIGPKGEAPRLIVKPPASSGSDLTFECTTIEQVEAAVARILGERISHGVRSTYALVTHYIWGTEYASQFVSVTDPKSGAVVHVPTDFWEYVRDKAPGGASRLDADFLLSYDDPAVPALLRNGIAILNGLGVRFGASHLETKGGVLLDPNIRTCGAFLPQAVERATGYGQIQGTVDAIHNVPRLLGRLGGYRVRKPTAVIFVRSIYKRGIFLDREIQKIISKYRRLYGKGFVRDESFSIQNGDPVKGYTTDARTTLGQMTIAHSDRAILEAFRAEIRNAEQSNLVVRP